MPPATGRAQLGQPLQAEPEVRTSDATPTSAPETLRRHFIRAIRRMGVLAVADLATFWLLREAYRLIAHRHVMGERLGSAIERILPAGYVDGWQLAVALVLGLAVTGAYGRGDERRDAGRLLGGAALAASVTLWSAAWTRGIAVVLPQYVITVMAVWVGLVIERLWLDHLLMRFQLAKRPERLLFIGAAADRAEARGSPAFTYPREYEPAGELDVSEVTAAGPALGLQMVRDAIGRSRADTVVVCGGIPDATLQTIVDAARLGRCRLLATSHAWDVAGVDPILVWHHGEPVIELTTPSVQAPQLVVKRALDLVVGVAGLIVLLPLVAVIAALIRLDSRGPAFYASERWGQGGRRIRIWKFRTMVAEAASLLETDAALRSQFEENVKLAADPRVTRVGRVLRRLSIDELPQFFSVLKGDMSLVGPRPKLPGEERRYGALFNIVLSVPPGMTGLWQVSGRNNVSYEQRILMDVDYVRRCSLRLDMKILLQTIPVVLRGEGAH